MACLFLTVSPTDGATTAGGLESSTPLLTSAFGVRPPGSNTSPGVSNDNNAKTYGYSFTTTLDHLVVTHLGMFDSQSANPTLGFYQEHRVGLWTSAGALLADVRFPAGNSGTLEGMFRYADLASPLTLEPGITYVIGAYYPPVASLPIDRLVTNVHMPAAAEGFVLGTTRFRFGQNMPFPDAVTINMPYVGPTLRFEVIPEPSALLLLAIAAAASLALSRQRGLVSWR